MLAEGLISLGVTSDRSDTTRCKGRWLTFSYGVQSISSNFAQAFQASQLF
jgi:hypothetical protein